MIAMAREHEPGTTGMDKVRILLPTLVGFFQMFGVWDKVPDLVLVDYSNESGWLGDVLRAKTRMRDLLSF
jgi:hypothetical protein